MNEQRRTFRGRGGPTDRRLPEHNARRRRRPTASKPGTSKYSEGDARAKELARISFTHDDGSDNVPAHDTDVDRVVLDAGASQTNDNSTADCALDDTVLDPAEEELVSFRKEVNHLVQRIRNNKSSVQTSTLASNKPSNYKTNVLRAVQNCVIEWKSILKHYPRIIGNVSADENHNSVVEDKESFLCKATGLALFELLQLALQCGPLAGAKAGYFKRCSSETAKLVLDFLDETIADRQTAMDMYWSEKQADAIEKWKSNASGAILKDKPASKSVQKKRQKARQH